jgi:2-polyprenyl-6-methoxyphenol hydroxylase-like FAD-dependent oxidoreductase
MRVEGRGASAVVARSRSIIIAGAGIGGLTAALTLTRAGYRAVVLEQAARLEEAGAGIQLSPNATRVLAELGLADRLRPLVVAPEAIRIMAGSGREIVRVPLGQQAEQRYGAPYWVIHRANLQAVLAAAIEQSPDITLRLGTRVEDFAVHQHGITVQARTTQGTRDEQGIALIGADGLWSGRPARATLRAAHRLARRGARRAADAGIPRAHHKPVARARCASRALSGEGRPRDEHRGDRPRRLARARLERAR